MVENLLEAFDNAECKDIECYASIAAQIINEQRATGIAALTAFKNDYADSQKTPAPAPPKKEVLLIK